MSPSSGNQKRILILTVCIVLFLLSLQNIPIALAFLGKVLQIILPFLVGLCIAFVFNVPMRLIETRLLTRKKPKKPPGKIWLKVKRPLSLLLTLLLVATLVFVVLFLILPELSRSMQQLAKNVPPFFNQIQQWLQRQASGSNLFSEWLSRIQIDWNKIAEQFLSMLQGGAGNLMNLTFQAIVSVIGAVVTFVLGFVFAVYVLLQKEKLGLQCRKFLAAYLPKPTAIKIRQVVTLADHTFTRFLSGQCLESAILGALFFLSMTLFRFPYPLMISILIAFTSLVPLFGSLVGCGIGLLFIGIAEPGKAFWFLLLFVAIQQIEGNLIYPYVVGNSVGLPSIWVLVAVTIGGAVWGVFGMLLCIPLSSMAYTLLRSDVNHRLTQKHLSLRRHDHLNSA